FSTSLLYYPQGVTLLLHYIGPVLGLLALPFWGLGTEAAYNATLLTANVLTAYAMYLLARGLNFSRPISLFAGVVFLAAPITLSGLLGHADRVFAALLPLVILTTYHALHPKRPVWWVLIAAGTLLLTALHNGYQFAYAALALGFSVIATFLLASSMMRP